MPRSGPAPALILAAVAAISPALAQAEPPGQESYPKLKIGGFSDFNFFASDETGVSSGFREGQFILHFVSELSAHTSFFGELSLTATDSDFSTEVERAFIKFDRSDLLKLSFGRFHTPINWWNTAFHHGQWLQTTVSRPEMTRFGGEFIPVHFVGGLAEGAIPSGGAGLSYEAGIGNGRGERIGRGGDAGDINDSRAWLARITAKPARPFGLQAGAAVYGDKIGASRLDESFRETIVSAYVVWSREDPELIGEYARTRHRGLRTDAAFTSEAWYAQAAYRLPFWKARLKPYARWERIDVDEEDPVYAVQRDRRAVLAGVRIDVATLVAVKLEARHERKDKDPYVDAIHGQISFAF